MEFRSNSGRDAVKADASKVGFSSFILGWLRNFNQFQVLGAMIHTLVVSYKDLKINATLCSS